MDVKRISNVIILKEVVFAKGNMFLINIECEDRGENSSPYVISYYVLGGGDLAEIDNPELSIIDNAVNKMLYRLGDILKGDMHESEYC